MARCSCNGYRHLNGPGQLTLMRRDIARRTSGLRACGGGRSGRPAQDHLFSEVFKIRPDHARLRPRADWQSRTARPGNGCAPVSHTPGAEHLPGMSRHKAQCTRSHAKRRCDHSLGFRRRFVALHPIDTELMLKEPGDARASGPPSVYGAELVSVTILKHAAELPGRCGHLGMRRYGLASATAVPRGPAR